ncbi:hypothetical protein DL765_010226 [Monosporascus sp. GIB2]|nr:hypothetical protein DL765_010226 [Monosporascus sp. GIB2]
MLVSRGHCQRQDNDSGVTLPRFILNDFRITALPPGRTEIRGNEREIGAFSSSQYSTQTTTDRVKVSSDGNAAQLSNNSVTDLDGEDGRGSPVLVPRGATAPVHCESNLTIAGMLRARRRYKCDIWSLGFALPECVAGLPAYQSSRGHEQNWFRYIGRHLERNRDSLSRVGPGFVEPLTQMLTQTPSSRPEAITCSNRI